MNKESLSKYRVDKQVVLLEHFLDSDEPVTFHTTNKPHDRQSKQPENAAVFSHLPFVNDKMSPQQYMSTVAYKAISLPAKNYSYIFNTSFMTAALWNLHFAASSLS